MRIDLSYNKEQISSVFLGSSLILVFLLLIFLIRPVLGAFGFTVVFAYILHPIVEFILPYARKRSLAILFTLVFFLIPFFIFSIILTSAIISQLGEVAEIPAVKSLLGLAGANVRTILALPTEEFTSISNLTQGFGHVATFLVGLGSFFLQLFLAIFFTVYVLYKEDTLLDLSTSIKNKKISYYINFVDHALQQVVYSMFVTAFVTGIIATVVYILFGLPFPILLGTITAIINLIPVLGVSLIYIPIAIYMIIQIDLLRGIAFLVVSILFISIFPDLFIRPFLAARKERINLGALVLGFVTGALAFGPVGVILGPLIIIAVVGFIRIFLFEEPEPDLV